MQVTDRRPVRGCCFWIPSFGGVVETEDFRQLQRFFSSILVVWSDERNFTGYDIFTLGAFSCEGIESNKVVGKFKIEKDSFYQIHSHLSFHSFPYGSRLHHAISREHRSVSLPLASENVTITHNCTAVTPPSDRVTIDGTCFTSSLLATDQLIVGDLISIELKLNGITVIHPLSPIVKRTPGVNLVYDGKSSYFSIVKLGKLNNK